MTGKKHWVYHPIRPSRVRIQDELRRVPSDYCWKLFSLLLESCSDSVSSPVLAEMRAVARRRDISGYYGLGESYGLQCISRESGVPWGQPEVLHLLTSTFRKHTSMSLVAPRQRREACLSLFEETDRSLPLRPVGDWQNDSVFIRMRGVLHEILGAAPTMDELVDRSRHGPGSTSTIGYKNRSRYFKYFEWPFACSPSARPLLIHAIRSDQRWIGSLEHQYRERYGIPTWRVLNQEQFLRNIVHDEHSMNSIAVVPKDGRKDRPIAKEPTGNMFLQLGLGSILRGKLLSIGIDLDRQQDINRRMAIHGSRHDDLFTIDLSNASDTVSLAFCEAVLPPGWFSAISVLRSPFGVLPDGRALRYAKVSSMGNGFTFELETLLFLSLMISISQTYGASSDRIAVFGDDLIGESYLYKQHVAYLKACCFQPNQEKSFWQGPVRESCGVDAFFGRDIRPVFLKENPADIMAAYAQRNRLRAWFIQHRGEFPSKVDDFLRSYMRLELVGPSNEEWESHLHTDYPVGAVYLGLQRKTVNSQSLRDFWSRKLMHSLRDCTSEGGNFLFGESSLTYGNMVEGVASATTRPA